MAISAGDWIRGLENDFASWLYKLQDRIFTVAVYKLQDRILFRCRKKNTTACLCYSSAVTQRESDHKPVYAVFDVMLKPGTDTYVLSMLGRTNHRYVQLVGAVV